MKKFHVLRFIVFIILFSSCRKDLFERRIDFRNDPVVMNPGHPMKDSIQSIIDKYVAKGLPGVQVAVKNKDGWYFANGGYAKIESKTPFQSNAPTWLFSITKTYTAAMVMKQKEKGKVDLDTKISVYLPAYATACITGNDKITVRMLLNHSSGIVNFTELPAFQLAQFNNPLKQPDMKAILEMVKGKELMSEPGTEYYYCNTNYLLLTLILENISGMSYKELLKTEIIKPQDLQNTYFDLSDGRAAELGFPNYYIDRYANEQLENATAWNNALARACMGWGGVASTPADAILFYEALMKGKVVSQASLNEMLTWFQGKSSDAPNYGFGIEYFQYADKSTPQRGHEGDGIANSTLILYVPDNDTYLFVNVTAGRQIFGPYLFKITDFKNELSAYIARWR